MDTTYAPEPGHFGPRNASRVERSFTKDAPLTALLQEQLSSAIAQVETTTGRLVDTHQRLFGSLPPHGVPTAPTADAASTVEGELRRLLEGLRGRLENLDFIASQLGERL